METVAVIDKPPVADIADKKEKRELSEEQRSKLKDRMKSLNAVKKAEKDEKKAIKRRLEDLEMERYRQKIIEAEIAVDETKKVIEKKLVQTVEPALVETPLPAQPAPPPPSNFPKETPYETRMRLTKEALLRSMGL